MSEMGAALARKIADTLDVLTSATTRYGLRLTSDSMLDLGDRYARIRFNEEAREYVLDE